MKRTIKADPSKWSAKSRQTMALHFTKHYEDIEYTCWRCRKAAVFSAEDQQHSFEVKKNHIDQRRSLCEVCWHQSNSIRKDLMIFEQRWLESKAALRKDHGFMRAWLQSLLLLEQYVPHRPDTAKKNMLSKLLAPDAQPSVPADVPASAASPVRPGRG